MKVVSSVLLAVIACAVPALARAQVWDGEDLSLTAAGGTVTTANKFLSIDAPAGAVSATTTLYVRPNHFAPDTPFRLISPAMSLSTGSTKLGKAVTITYHFSPSELPTGLLASSARLFRVVGHQWVLVPSSVNTANNYVTATVTSLGTFAVIASTNSVAPENGLIYRIVRDGFVYRYRPDTGDNQLLNPLRVSDGDVYFSPTEDTVLFGRPLTAGFDVYSANIDHTGVHKILTMAADGVSDADISPDGKFGIFSALVSSHWSVYSFSTTGGTPTLFASGSSVDTPAFSHDGTQIAYSSGTTISIRNASTGVLVKTLTPGGTNVANLCFNPTASALSFTMVSNQDHLPHLYTQTIANGGPVSRTVGGPVDVFRSAWSPDGTLIAVYLKGSGICILDASKTNQDLIVTVGTTSPARLLWR